MTSTKDSITYSFSSDINLDDLINNAIIDLTKPENNDDVRVWESGFKEVESSIKDAEKQQKYINSLFDDCDSKIEEFIRTLEDEMKIDELENKEFTKEAEKAKTDPNEITIVDSDDEGGGDNNDDDEDDDVQFIQSTFDPQVAIKRQGENLLRLSRQDSQDPAVPPSPSQTRANLTAALSNAGNPQPKSVGEQNILNSLGYLTSQLASSPQKQPSSSSSVPQFVPLSPGRSTIMSTTITPPTQPPQQNVLNLLNQKLQNQERMERLFLEDVNKVNTGTMVLTKRNSDIWQKGIVQDVFNRNSAVEERKYKVRYAKNQSKTLQPRQVAFYDCINKAVTVGTRIIALYKDGETEEDFYAGIIAEAPNGRNELRYLVFFDDGYAQYCTSKELHKVFLQSRNVWEDIHPDSKDFIKDYLAQYPERPMVRLHKNQTVKTEWNGKWWTAKVMEVDASLALMYFPYDKRSEWIYRGSTRLEPLYTALANAEANRNAGKVKRHNLSMGAHKTPVVEYTRNSSTDASPKPPEKKKATARKSTTPTTTTTLNTGQVWDSKWLKIKDHKPSLKILPQDKYSAATISSPGNSKGKDMASVLQDRLTAPDESGAVDLESQGTRLDHIIPGKDKNRKRIVPHKCGRKCVSDVDDNPDKMKGDNPLLIPLLFGWERHVAKTKPYGRRSVLYRAPCGRRLRTLDEIDHYLQITDAGLAIDNFCCDPELHVHHEFIPVKTFCDIKDISYGKENVVISCVNGIDIQYPDYVDYSNQRIPATGVRLNLDPDFLECCDCTDNCRDSSKCRCQQLTVETSSVINGGKTIPGIGYHHRRLQEPLLSGVYECNSRCKCDKRCRNRVVQNGLSNRLQVFKTEKRGWGLRCLDDIPKGGFICIYAGQLLTDQGANEDGQQYGDEYLAELDYIEVVERQKEGYESDVEDIDEVAQNMDADYESDSDNGNSSDSDKSFSDVNLKRLKTDDDEAGRSHHTRRSSRLKSQQEKQTECKVSSDEYEGSSDKNSKKKQTAQKSTSSSNRPTESSDNSLPDVDDTSTSQVDDSGDKKRRTGRSSGARYGALNPTKKDNKEEPDNKDDSYNGSSTRDYYKDGQSCYIMDAKSMGNIGRYLNHSCTPNAFVQNVFVDTHDMRFPWIAFFAGQYISAGSELTWDYNYEVGSVPGKVLYCYCGSAECRGRLL